MSGSRLDYRGFAVASWLILALVAAAALLLAWLGRWFDTLAMGALVALGVVFLLNGRRLPGVFSLLFVVAALVNTAGYAFDVWHDPIWFDEVVHAYTSFAGMAAIGWLIVRGSVLDGKSSAWRLIVSVTAIGLAIGVLWEIFEWAIGIIGTRLDTRRDLVMDTLGAIAAGLWCAWVAGRLAGSRR